MDFRVKDLSLSLEGKMKIDWAQAHMPVPSRLREQHENIKPLKGIRVAGCLHVTKETGVLARTLLALEQSCLGVDAIHLAHRMMWQRPLQETRA